MHRQHLKIQVMTVIFVLATTIISTATGADSLSLRKNWFCFQGGGTAGGAGGIAPSLQWLDLSPVEDVVKNETDLGLYRFSFKDNGFMLVGGMGYGGTRCGASIGGGGWFGYKKFVSASRTVPLQDSLGNIIFRNSDTVKVDSAARLYTMIAYGGFLAEKN